MRTSSVRGSSPMEAAMKIETGGGTTAPTLRPDSLDIGPEGLARLSALGLRPEQLPRHVAIIMDGNGRWAQNRGQPRIFGHRQGIRSVRSVVEEGCRIGLDQLTLYCLS